MMTPFNCAVINSLASPGSNQLTMSASLTPSSPARLQWTAPTTPRSAKALIKSSWWVRSARRRWSYFLSFKKKKFLSQSDLSTQRAAILFDKRLWNQINSTDKSAPIFLKFGRTVIRQSLLHMKLIFFAVTGNWQPSITSDFWMCAVNNTPECLRILKVLHPCSKS